MKPFPIIVSSPSGAGKTTIVDAVLKRDTSVSRVITATTRAPRTGEKNGVDYHFWTIKQFEQAIKKGQMLEWAQVHTHYYGIPKKSVDDLMKKGICPILVIDVQGARTVKAQYPNAATVFIVPPSLKELKNRILRRNDNTQDIEIRLETAKKEMQELDRYDYALLNDELAEAVDKMAGIVAAEQCRVCRQDLKIKNLK
ncbi:guanylate kinase [Candidatus Avelusimicrobium fimicolum]|jgi:guanylate kinase|uniref:guanylate kinase n=1 Tax=Candidatus Avelusimicrobium fimicolum TaxID=3416216 RepID=UPI002A907120|nr:guanylate kinase [Spirochaetia bacterium]MDY3910841.1 guanylate kinase [Elusimicrobiaceae bacterium]